MGIRTDSTNILIFNKLYTPKHLSSARGQGVSNQTDSNQYQTYL